MANYNDERLVQVQANKNQALKDLEETYGDMVRESESYYQAQIDASKQWAETQSKLQQEKTDFAIDQIEQQKVQTGKDYKKEQSGAYVDYQKESNRYGVNAEYMAANGLAGSGYSESSQVNIYNSYQNRVATARESYNLAIANYNNKITEARMQNSSVLAEIAYQSLQQQLELSLAGFQYKNQLLAQKESQKTTVEDTYHRHYMDVLDQINTENALAEEIRQFNASLAEERRQYDETMKAKEAENNSSVTVNGDRQAVIKEDSLANTSAYESAAGYVKSIGGNAAGIMTRSEWAARKKAGHSVASSYSTYDDYLDAYKEWSELNR